MLGFDRRDVRMGINLFRMTMRDRYLGSRLGLMWSITSPLLLLATFTFVFGFVFKARLPGAETSITYVIWLISGYGPWLAISEGLSSSTSSVVSNAGIIKNLPFKTELLPIVGALTGIIPLLVAVAFGLALQIWIGFSPSWPLLFVPIVLIIQFVLVAGLGLHLAALNVFVRDVSMALPTALLLVLFASPIFYDISQYPSRVRPVLAFNPFYLIAECFRQPLVYGRAPSNIHLVVVSIVSAIVFLSGLRFFRRLKSHFDSRL